MVLCGGAGMGKTTVVEKLLWDWASDVCLQHFAFLLPLRVSTLCKTEQSLESLLLRTNEHLSSEALTLALTKPQSILLVLDKLEDFQNIVSEPPPTGEPVSDSQQAVDGAVLLYSLLEGSLLPGASVLFTSREAVFHEALQCVHVLGFSKAQRRTYFEHFFSNKDVLRRVLHECEQAVGVSELCVCPAFCWTLCRVCKESVPETLTELCCSVTCSLLQEHSVDMERARLLLCGLGKLADHCITLSHTHCSTAEVISCGLQPFLGSSVLSAFLRISREDDSSPDPSFSFLSPVFQEFLLAVYFYTGQTAPQSRPEEARNLDEGPDLYLMFLAGLSDPAQRKVLAASVGQLNSGHIAEFFQWLTSSVPVVLKGFERVKQWRILRVLHHAHSPTLVRENVKSTEWRMLSYNGIQGPDCAALGFVARCLGELEYLNLYMSKLTDDQAQKLIPALQLAKSINLCQSRLSPAVITHLARALMDGQTTRLDLSSSSLGDEALKSLLPGLRHCSLHTLNLRTCSLTPDCGESLGKMLSASNLCVLELGGNDLQDQGLIQLLTALGKSCCKLQDLSLDRCDLSGECIAVLSSALSTSLSKVKKLNLSWNGLGEHTLETLSRALQSGRSSLNALLLFDCEMTDSCCPSIVAILQSHSCSLTELELSVNELDESGGLLICDALRSPSCPLEKLRLGRCELTEQVFRTLGSVLVLGTSKLKELNIGLNNVGDAGAKHIWQALKHTHCKLQHLDLEMISLTDDCVDELCEAVGASSSLTTLILKNNSLTDISVPRLVKLAQDRPIMEELNLQYNDFSDDVFELMDVCPKIRY
ncbi:NACHT, LRR and PYD domains-containing protein 12 isoform X2 [Hoplias malabaricus]